MKTIFTFLACSVIPFSAFHQVTVIEEMGYDRYAHACAAVESGMLSCGGFDGESTLASAEIYDPVSDQWNNTGDMNEQRESHTADALDQERIIVIGGWDGSATNHATTEIFDASTLEFSDGPTMNTGRSYHRTAMYENYLIVFGGYDGISNLSSCEKLNLTTMEFEEMESMSFGRSSFTVTRIGTSSQFLITGGFNPDFGFQMNQCEIYDAAEDTWTTVASMDYARDNHAAIALPDGRVLVSGGRFFNGDLNLFEGMNECEIYDPENNEWTETDATTGKHSYHQLFFLDDLIILPGGTNHSGIGVDLTYSNTEVFDLLSNSWSDGGYEVEGRYQYAGAITAQGLVVCGGEGDNSNTGELYSMIMSVGEGDRQALQVFPSLVSVGERVNITIAPGFEGEVRIYNAAGQQCFAARAMTQVVAADFAPGLYMLQLCPADGSIAESHKLVVR